jgi:alkanesulfonate monooxygenase SsuD/methylene tetrahydromethanopterin reductase-like flavin-dependent oxidoreductase (luciferase family)
MDECERKDQVTMKFGFVTSFGSVHDYITMAKEAEAHGWDGVFAWDAITIGPRDVFDPWVTLGAMAAVTSRITLGGMVFSPARRRPWKVARETATLDHLSNGRLVIPVGLGGTWDGGYDRVNTDDPDLKVRAGKMDECLEILDLAWKGEPFDFDGKYYQCRDLQFQPRPVQQPRIPVWTVGAWPRPKSMARAARWDGIIVADMTPGRSMFDAMRPDTVSAARDWIVAHREASTPYDIIVEGETSGSDHAANRERLQPLAEAGATWWIESRWKETESAESLLDRIRQGPPRLS